MVSLPRSSSHRPILASLVLIFWTTRLINLDGLAYFFDEANHLWWARLVWQGQPFLAASDGRLLNVLWMSVFWPFNAGVWVSRASVVLIAVIGFVCLLDFTRRAFSLRAALLAGLLYTFLPLTFFFERMALADSLSASFVSIAIWAAGRSLLPVNNRVSPFNARKAIWVAIGGLVLTGAVFVKLSNLIFLCIPFFAALFTLRQADWRRSTLLVIVMYGACFVTLLPSAYIVYKVGQSDLGIDLLTLKASVPLEQIPVQAWHASLVVANNVAAYLPFPIWLVVLLGITVATVKSNRITWFLLATLLTTLAALISRTSPDYLESRFLPVYAPLAVALAGAGLAALTAKPKSAWVALGLILLISPGLLFAWQGWTQPSTLSLPRNDRWQYITGWPSGYGVRELADEMVEQNESLQLVTLSFANWEKLEAYLIGRTDRVGVRLYKPGLQLGNSLLVVDEPEDNSSLAKLGLTLTEIARYPRPSNESAVVLYRIEP